MAGWRERWRGLVSGRGGGGRVTGAPVGKFRMATRPEDGGGWPMGAGAYLPLPSRTPFEMLRVYRYLRDTVPDISDGVWTWKRLCQTGYDVEIVEASSEVAKARVRMRENRTVDVLREGQARQVEIENVLRMKEAGVIGAEEVSRRLTA